MQRMSIALCLAGLFSICGCGDGAEAGNGGAPDAATDSAEPDGGDADDDGDGDGDADAGSGGPDANGKDCRFVWAKGAGGTEDDNVFGLAVLPDGASIITGFFRGTALFGKGEAGETSLTSQGLADIFMAKLGPQGDLLWVRSAGGVGEDHGNGIAVSKDGSFVITGAFADSATFGQGETHETTLTGQGSDVFIAKYDKDGRLIWAKQAGGPAEDVGESAHVLQDGSILMAGSISGAATFGKGETNETILGGNGIFLAKYDSAGNFIWARGTTGNGHAWATIDIFGDGYIAMAGSFSQDIVFGPGEANETTIDTGDVTVTNPYLAEFSSDGSLAWARHIHAGGGDEGGSGASDIKFLPDGTSVVTGSFISGATFGDGEPNETHLQEESCSDPLMSSCGDIFIARYDSDGSLVWAKGAGGNDTDNGIGIVLPAGDSFVLFGSYIPPATLGKGESNEVVLDTDAGFGEFLARYDLDGVPIRVNQLNDGWGDVPELSADGSFFLMGTYYGQAIFGKGEDNETVLAGGYDANIFIARYHCNLALASGAGYR